MQTFLLMFCHRRAINVPTRLLDLLDIHKLQHDNDTLLIHFSSDQVYDGSRPYWREDDGCSPCNVYGVTKREAEVLIQVSTCAADSKNSDYINMCCTLDDKREYAAYRL